MIYYKSIFKESKSFLFGTKLSEKLIVGFPMRYDFKTTHLYENNWISGWGYCCGMDFRKTTDEGFEYYRTCGPKIRGMITIKNKVIHECLQEIQNDIISRG